MATLTPDTEYDQLLRMNALQTALRTFLSSELEQRSLSRAELAHELRLKTHRLQRFLDGINALTLRPSTSADHTTLTRLTTLARAAMKRSPELMKRLSPLELEHLMNLTDRFTEIALSDRLMGMTIMSPCALSLYRDLRTAHQTHCPNESHQLFAGAFGEDAATVKHVLDGRREALNSLITTVDHVTSVSDIGARLLAALQSPTLKDRVLACVRAEDEAFARVAEAYITLFNRVRNQMNIGVIKLYALMNVDRTPHSAIESGRRGSMSIRQLQDMLRRLIGVTERHGISVDEQTQQLATAISLVGEPPLAMPSLAVEDSAAAPPTTNTEPSPATLSDQELLGELVLRMARGQIPNTVLQPFARPIPPLIGDTDAGLEHCVTLLEATRGFLGELVRSGTPLHEPTLRALAEQTLSILDIATGKNRALLQQLLKKGRYATSIQELVSGS